MATDGIIPVATPEDELQQLRAEVGLLRAQHEQQVRAQELARAQLEELLKQREEQQRTIDHLQQQLQSLLRRIYGRSAEKLDPNQMQLFETLLNGLAPKMFVEPEPSAGSAEQDSHAAHASAAASAAASARKGHGRRRLPSDLPRTKVIHDLPEAQKPCPCCGQLRHVISQEISEQLDYVPANLNVIEHVRLTYACRHCEQQVAEGGPQIETAAKPLSPIEKGLAAPGLLSYVVVSKYGDHLPLYRLENILQRHEVQIARSTMCGWMAQCAALLRPLHELMIREVRASKVIHTDDTPVEVLEPGRGRTRTGRFWVYVGDANHPLTVFDYTPSRSRDGPRAFLKDWSGFLQADAFGGYDGIYAGQVGGQVTEVACWAHARRKFYEARTSDAAMSAQALAYIRLLYDVEKETKGLPAARRQALRQEHSAPRLEQFGQWLHAQQAAQGGPVLPKSPMGQAITYALNQWSALNVYATDGDLTIDNNASENALRRVALGRKNWLFCGSDNGGQTAAVLFSLIATCQRHQVEPLNYFRNLLTRVAAQPVTRLAELLPANEPKAHP